MTSLPSPRWSLVPSISFLGILAFLPGCVQPANLRILTYNTAFLYAEIEHPARLPPPSLPFTACVSCNPFGIPPVSVTGTLFCECWPSASIWPNLRRFANISESERAQQIADRILATDQDVVVLNEVFHPEARQVFVDRLSGQGPYDFYISRLRGHAPVEGLTLGDLIQMAGRDFNPILGAILADLPEIVDYRAVSADSGLMIFSRHPFMPLQGPSVSNDAACGDPECEFAGQNGPAPLGVGSFAFEVFTACEEEDCWASKGVGLVKLKTPGAPSYVAFTHLQADYPDDSILLPHTRAQQYDTMREVILGAIPKVEIENAQVYLAGDLNTAAANRMSPQQFTTQEWHDVFNPDSSSPNTSGGFFACGNGIAGTPTEPCRFGINGSRLLTDAWGFETSTTDLGVTNVDDGKRLDYILHSDPSAFAGTAFRGRCMQHAMIAWDLQADPDGSGGMTWLSDHFPVRADFGRAARWCSPNDDPEAAIPARNVRIFQFGPTNCAASGPNPACKQDEVVSAPEAILVSGGFQWFRIDQAGTYSIDMSSSPAEPVDYVVYQHTDLSRPIEPSEEEEGEFGIVYSMPEPPYYIRTFAVNGAGVPVRNTTTRSYSLRVHQHLCRSPQDACLLEPGLGRVAPYTYVWPTTVTGDPLTELRELWWRFKTSGVKGGQLVGRDTDGQDFPTVRIQMEGSTPETYGCVTAHPPVLERWNDPLFPGVLEEELEFIETQIDPGDHDWENDGHRDDLRLAPDLPAQRDGELQSWFIKVTRDSSFLDTFNVCNAGMTSWVSYLTDLTYVVSQRMQMWAELDDDPGADDNLRIYLGFDESGPHADPPSGASVDKTFEEPDSGSVSALLHGYPPLRGYFVQRAWPNLWEKDEEELLGVWDPLPPFFAGIETLGEWDISLPLKPTGPEDSPQIPFVQFSDDANGDDADYYYYWYYKLCHLESEPVCSNP